MASTSSLSAAHEFPPVAPASIKFDFIASGEKRRVPRSTLGSYAELRALLAEYGADEPCVVSYLDEDGDAVLVTSDLELEEAFAVAKSMNAKVFKFTVHPSKAAFLESVSNKLAGESPITSNGGAIRDVPSDKAPKEAVHPGVVCDKSGMAPIVGPRYHVPGNNYDLCQAEFDKLPEAERNLFVRIDKPGARPIHCAALGTKPPQCPIFEARRLAKEVLGSAQLPIEMSLDDMLLQAMISASMFNNQGTAHSHHGTGEPSPPGSCSAAVSSAAPLSELLSAFMGPTALAAIKEVSSAIGAAAESAATPKQAAEDSDPKAGISDAEKKAHDKARDKTEDKAQDKTRGGPHPLTQLVLALGAGAGAGGGCRKLTVHPGITCDRSSMSPIVGPRYHVLGNNYDLCEAEFDKLAETERCLYVRIDKPGASPVPCLSYAQGDLMFSMVERGSAVKGLSAASEDEGKVPSKKELAKQMKEKVEGKAKAKEEKKQKERAKAEAKEEKKQKVRVKAEDNEETKQKERAKAEANKLASKAAEQDAAARKQVLSDEVLVEDASDSDSEGAEKPASSRSSSTGSTESLDLIIKEVLKDEEQEKPPAEEAKSKAATEPKEAAEPTDFEAELASLADMGFLDREENLAVLKRFNGSLGPLVLNALLDKA